MKGRRTRGRPEKAPTPAVQGGATAGVPPIAAEGVGSPAAILTRPDLAAAIRAGEPAVLKAVVEYYLLQILRTARGAGLSPQDAEEVTQETFTTFLEAAPRFEGRSHVRTFLFGILFRKIAEARRRFAHLQQHDPIDEVVESRFTADGRWSRTPATADELVRRSEIRRWLAECLEASPMAQRMAFHLREVEGLNRHEICRILEITPNNLDVMLHRLRNRTRECLEDKIVGPAP
jgi:RNA polymerase sigma-70 factor (ECF subfamily)